MDVTPVERTACASCLQSSVIDCVLVYSSPALNFRKKDAGSESTRIITAASMATDCLVCTDWVIILPTELNNRCPMEALIIKNPNA